MATVVGLFESIALAQQAAQKLVDSGVQRDDISLIAHEASGDSSAATGTPHTLVLPGIGPLHASGPLVAALTTNSQADMQEHALIGALLAADVSEHQAHVYAEGVRRNGALVAVHGDNTLVSAAYATLHQNGAVNIDEQGAQWRQAGWERFDPDAGPYAAEQQEGDPVVESEDEANPASHSVSASFGALSGGVVAGAYGAASDVIFGTEGDEHRPDWERD